MNTINICGIPFNIKEVDEIPPDIPGEVIHGEISHSRAEILLRESLPKELKQLALIHEWVHGVLVMIGRTDLSDDEIVVQNVALAINQTFEIKEEVEEWIEWKDFLINEQKRRQKNCSLKETENE